MWYDPGMALPREEAIDDISAKHYDIPSHLNERSRRIWVATEARSYRWGGITVVSQATMKEVKAGLKEYLRFYNEERFHQGLDDRKQAEVYSIQGAEKCAA